MVGSLKRNPPTFWEEAWGKCLVWPPKMANLRKNGARSKMLVIGAADELELIFQPKRGDGSPCTAAGCRKNRKP